MSFEYSVEQSGYQRYCIDYIKDYPVSALFLDMGLGKTIYGPLSIQVISKIYFEERTEIWVLEIIRL